MELRLAENIRALRRQNDMTQEQLAEALGVTPGAVYKWENGRSTPEVRLLAEMADLFDVSMDALLGYTMKESNKEYLAERISQLSRERDVAGAEEEAERALKKYPNTFLIVYRCAVLYGVKSINQNSQQYALRALELYQHALRLIGQNTDESITALSIQGHIATIYTRLKEYDKAVELLKKNNPYNVNSARIGELLASACERPNEAIAYLSDGVLEYMMLLWELTSGYLNVYVKTKQYQEALDVLSWGICATEVMRIPEQKSALDKMLAVDFLLCGQVHLLMGDVEQARKYLRRAKDTARAFDADPCYACSHIRFVMADEKAAIHDSMGATAMEALQNHVEEENNPDLTALWEAIKDE